MFLLDLWHHLWGCVLRHKRKEISIYILRSSVHCLSSSVFFLCIYIYIICRKRFCSK
jgi:hypothetical protein